jgi:hypothetical protein
MKRALALTAALSLLAACSLLPTKIADIQKDPGRFENHDVTVRGKVDGVTRLPFMAEGTYELDDGSGIIRIVTKGSLPADGSTVTVRGKVSSTFEIAGRSYGLVVREK